MGIYRFLDKRKDKLELKRKKHEFKSEKKEHKYVKKDLKNKLKEAKIEQKEFLKDNNKNLNNFNAKKENVKNLKKLVDIKDVDEEEKKKKDKIKAKKEYKRTKKNFYKKYPKASKRLAKYTIEKAQTKNEDLLFSDDDTFDEYVQAKRKYDLYRYRAIRGKQTTKNTIKGGGRLAYSIHDRLLNLTAGKGFKRTPKEFRLRTKISKKLNSHRKYRILKEKFKKYKKRAKRGTSPFRFLGKRILRNPLSIMGIISFLILAILFTFFLASTPPMNMEEDNVNSSWIYLTKLDRENSNEKVEYYSNIEDDIYFINYRYDKSINDMFGAVIKQGKLKDSGFEYFKNKNLIDTEVGKNYLKGMWEYLNKDYKNIKTIESLYQNPGMYYLNDKEIKEYKEMQNISSQIGKFPYMQEVSNFLYTSKDEKASEPLKIVKRFGYETKDKIKETTDFKLKKDSYLYAPFTGRLKIEGNNIIITRGIRRITFYNVENIRLSDGEQVIKEECLGQTSEEDKLEVKYEKYKAKKETEGEKGILDSIEDYINKKMDRKKEKEWQPVNIGFYLPFVEYLQRTQVKKDFKLDGDKVKRANKLISVIRQYVPDATNEGLAAILGNFDVESGINSKRAEGDYLPPPVGVEDESSWDNPDWLSIGGAEIYPGSRSITIHRGLGLGQWSDNSDGTGRHTLLLNYAEQEGKAWYDLELQVEFMLFGDSPYYQEKIREILTTTDSVENLTTRFLREWEGATSDSLQNRIDLANGWLDYLNKGGGGIDVPGEFSYDEALKVLELTNIWREQNGLMPIEMSDEFDVGTETRCKEFYTKVVNGGVANTMDYHSRLDGSPWYTAFDRVPLSEILAYNTLGASGVVEWWKHSPAHNEAMLNPNNRYTTIKMLYADDGNYYGIQIFS